MSRFISVREWCANDGGGCDVVEHLAETLADAVRSAVAGITDNDDTYSLNVFEVLEWETVNVREIRMRKRAEANAREAEKAKAATEARERAEYERLRAKFEPGEGCAYCAATTRSRPRGLPRMPGSENISPHMDHDTLDGPCCCGAWHRNAERAK